MTLSERKSIFNKIAIIDLPFYPFERGIDLEIKILNHISNNIINIEKSIRRKLSELKASKDFNFYFSDTLIAVDISSLVSREISYLEHLYNVINLYPFILINSSIDENRLKKLRLHSYLLKKGYILPVFYKINPLDKLYSDKRYGNKISQLISGKISELSTNEIENIDKLFSIDDLINRYTNLKLENNSLTYSGKICWLGVDSQEIQNLLSYLYNSNNEVFSINEVCRTFSIKNSELSRYIAIKRMLFDPIDDDQVSFRFLRKNTLLEIKSELLQSFENKLYQHSVIDTTETQYSDFKGTFKEYHSLGKLFDVNETYSIKLINNLKESFSHVEFDRIILVDNGYEDNLKILLDTIFSRPVSRLINNLGNPQLFPFDEFNFREKILLIIDLCNRGDFVASAIDFLKTSYNCQIVGIFSFIIDCDLNINKLKEKQSENRIIFKYYIEKELHDVKSISIKKQRERRQERSDERFLFFWDTMNQIGKIEQGIYSSTMRKGEFFNDIENFKTTYFQRIYISEKAGQTIQSHSDLSYFIEDLIVNYKFKGCLLNDTRSAKTFAKIFHKIDSNISTHYTNFNNPDDGIKKFYAEKFPILIYDDGLNLGINILRILFNLDKGKVITNNNVSVFVLFSRDNIIKRLNYIPTKFRDEIRKIVNNRFFTYYSSNLPYYLLNSYENRSDEAFERHITKLAESMTL